MEFDDNRVDTSGLDDRRGGGGGIPGGAIGAGVGGLGVIGLIIALLLGVDPSTLTGASQPQIAAPTSAATSAASGNLAARCSTAEAIATQDDCFVLKSFNETNEVWTQEFARTGQQYKQPRLVYYSGSVQTGGCGSATSAAGPFYCPGDQRVYIDLNFLNKLQRNYGADGRYAQAYIIAHEVGHHIQNITGIERQVRQAQQRNPRQANALSVKMELQADCLAGVWGRLANDNGNVKITQADYNEALNAASAVGDDAIMSSAGMRVNPEKFTHGSSAQRQQWFDRGYSQGSMAACDTFNSA